MFLESILETLRLEGGDFKKSNQYWAEQETEAWGCYLPDVTQVVTGSNPSLPWGANNDDNDDDSNNNDNNYCYIYGAPIMCQNWSVSCILSLNLHSDTVRWKYQKSLLDQACKRDLPPGLESEWEKQDRMGGVGGTRHSTWQILGP